MTPKEIGPGATTSSESDPTDLNDGSDSSSAKRQNGLSQRRLRREAAVRLPGGDPDNPGRRFHRPMVGLRDSGFREGYRRALEYALFAFGPHLDDLGLAKAEAILSRLGRWEDAQ